MMFGRSAPAPLATFKVGLLNATPENDGFRVVPDLRRGIAQLERQSDGATHLIWKDRSTQQIGEDLLIFPGDQTLTKVDTGNPTDRVYLLTFSTSASKRVFFWSQEPGDPGKDEEKVNQFNQLMNAPPAAAQPGRRPFASSQAQQRAPEVGVDELTAILTGLGYPGGKLINVLYTRN